MHWIMLCASAHSHAHMHTCTHLRTFARMHSCRILPCSDPARTCRSSAGARPSPHPPRPPVAVLTHENPDASPPAAVNGQEHPAERRERERQRQPDHVCGKPKIEADGNQLQRGHDGQQRPCLHSALACPPCPPGGESCALREG